MAGLTGAWTGSYCYDGRVASPESFAAWIDDAGDAICGETIEPNAFAPIRSATLMAGLSGRREGLSVGFLKVYSDIDQPPIRYEGLADPGMTRISGAWHFPSAPWVRGSFTMTRGDGAAVLRAQAMEAT